MGKSAPKQQTVTQKVELPGWVTAAGEGIYQAGSNAVNNMAAPFSGNLIPNFNKDQNTAFDMTRRFSGLALPGMFSAGRSAEGVANYDPTNVNAMNFTQANVGAYMDPFTANVENAALDNLNKMRLQSLNQTGDQALARGAFGGSRQGVMEGVTNAESAAQAGQLSAALRSQAFQNAQQQINADQNRNLQADMANQNAGIEGARTRLQGALGLSGIAQNGQQSALQGAAAMEAIGNTQYQQEAQRLAQDAQRYETARMWPYIQEQMKAQLISGVPYGQSTSTTGPATQQGSNMGMQMLGGGMMGAQLGSALAGSSLGATLGLSSGMSTGIGSVLGAILPFLSDKNMKTDIEKVGKDDESGLDLYAYRYKGDPKTYPKVVGPMAQDIEKKYPEQVSNVGGRKAVNLGFGPMRRAFQ